MLCAASGDNFLEILKYITKLLFFVFEAYKRTKTLNWRRGTAGQLEPRVHSFEVFYAQLPPSPSTGLRYICPSERNLCASRSSAILQAGLIKFRGFWGLIDTVSLRRVLSHSAHLLQSLLTSRVSTLELCCSATKTLQTRLMA
ncbi:hypothetical protein NDU88_005628 [Pleurodeles waltl]|uniref:Uncharacterized protein n=1 Tax=Pleurodeles waltl TaxID=8319 RepID=A0AAV7M9X1_PLEWA|nr:hypothetical protein NDU88_005628 [Pleurodeles waltl]